MKQTNYWVYFRTLLLIAVLFGAVSSPANAQCTRIVATLQATQVYDAPPTFYTGSGWKQGNLVATLAPHTQVAICDETKVGLFLDKKTWYRINFENGRSGWVFADQLLTATSLEGRPETKPFALIAQANAAASEDAPSPGVPPQGQLALVLCSSFFVLLGIIGKVIADEFDNAPAPTLRTCLQVRKFIRALVAAPLAFLAFLNFANFTMSGAVAVAVFCCLAFQNGFFWQTLVPTAKGANSMRSAGAETIAQP